MRRPLIDGDILLYEVGFAVEAGWKAENKEGLPPFDRAADSLDMRIANICAVVEATEPPVLYLTGKTNFRYEIAKRTPYKDRPSAKPFHYHNLKAYVKGTRNYIESAGMEADDELALEQTRCPSETIICSRDKDLRAVPGWHYSWENHLQPQWGPMLVDVFGKIELSPDRRVLRGYGAKFFYSQILTGDKVDSIPGLPKCGAVGAFECLETANTIGECYKRVVEAYRPLYGPLAEAEVLEQGRLLHMTRYLDEWGYPVLWEPPNE